MAQNLVVALLVGFSFAYALWTLAPKVPRSRLATALLKLPMPLRLQKPLIAAAKQQGGCGCDGCDAPKAGQRQPGTRSAKTGQVAPSQAQPLVFHPMAERKRTFPSK